MFRHLYVPLLQPQDIIPHLRKQEAHWRAGYSAQELAYSWFNAGNNFPSAVRAALRTAPEYAAAEMVDAHFECQVSLGTPGEDSHTDILVIASLQDRISVIAVEGKVNESFDQYVQSWNITPGKQNRLNGLCKTLGLDTQACNRIRYQLLHRTASAIYEAKRYRSVDAMMLVHSFSPTHRWFDDFTSFARLMGIPVARPGQCSAVKVCEGVNLRLCWVADTAQDTRPDLKQ